MLLLCELFDLWKHEITKLRSTTQSQGFVFFFPRLQLKVFKFSYKMFVASFAFSFFLNESVWLSSILTLCSYHWINWSFLARRAIHESCENFGREMWSCDFRALLVHILISCRTSILSTRFLQPKRCMWQQSFAEWCQRVFFLCQFVLDSKRNKIKEFW